MSGSSWSTKDRITNLALVLLALCAVTLTTVVVRRELAPRNPTPQRIGSPRATRVADWKRYSNLRGSQGTELARVTIVDFSDYQCPYCRIAADSLRALRQRYPDDVRIIYRHYPLQSIHPRALEMAVAAECARIQGSFEQFHDLLFRLQGSLPTASLLELAQQARIPSPERLVQCVRSGEGLAFVLEDVAAGDSLGVVGTPTILLNEYRFSGFLNLSLLDSLVQRALASSN